MIRKSRCPIQVANSNRFLVLPQLHAGRPVQASGWVLALLLSLAPFALVRAQDSPSKEEPAKTEPAKTEPAKTEPAKTEPAKTEPAKTERAKTEPAKTEPAKTEPAKTEPAKTEPAKTEPAKTEPAKTEPAKTEPAKTEPAKTEPAKTEPAKTEPAKTEPAKTEPAKTEPAVKAPAADPKAAYAAYQAKLEEWKGLLKELRSLKLKFDTAESGETAAIRKQWDELIERGGAMIPALRELGMNAYVADPAADRELERFLLKLLKDDMSVDRYEEAAVLGRAMVEAGCESREALDQAGVAAYCVNDYDSAEKYLKRAESLGSISEFGRRLLALVPEYKALWTKEQEIRQQEVEKNDLPRVKMTTSQGAMVIELFENEAPDTVGNFINLVEKGFYKELPFHRVLSGFMAQGGCPQGNGTGGPGYNIYCECYRPDYRRHFRGTLSMAHAGRDTGGSQFFITFVPTEHLNGRHTAFGRVIEGIEVLSKLQRIDPEAKEKPAPDTIETIEVLRKRDHDYKPKKVQ
ncbi:MAG: peptidylprolyl isomerase [Pirellulaceae bacterium]